MNQKLFLLSIILFFLVSTSLVKSDEVATDIGTTIVLNQEEKLQFLQAHPEECVSITLTFKIWHDKPYNTACWNTIEEKFRKLISVCQQAEKNPNNNEWAEIVGLDLPTIIELTKNKMHGINGNLSVTTRNETLSLESTFTRDPSFDQESWIKIVHLFSSYLSEHEFREHSPFISSVLDLATTDQAIHGSLELQLNR